MEKFWASGLDIKDKNGVKSKGDLPCDKTILDDFKAVKNPLFTYLLTWLPLLCLSLVLLLFILKMLKFFDDDMIFDNEFKNWLPIIISGYLVAGICLFIQRFFKPIRCYRITGIGEYRHKIGSISGTNDFIGDRRNSGFRSGGYTR